MDAPQKEQAPDSKELGLGDTDVESVLSAEFDRMAEAEESGDTEKAEDVSDEEEYEGLDASDEEVEPEQEVTEEVAQEEHQEAAESDYKDPAPERWPEEMRSMYNKLPPEARRMMMENVYKPMQRTYTKTTQELAQMRKAVEPMLQSLNQYRNDFERMGVAPEEAFRTQMAWAAHFAKVGPQQGVADMAAAYGQSPKASGQEEEEYLTPVERQMKSQIEELKNVVAGVGHQTQQATENQQRAHFQAQYNEVKQSLQSFTNEQKDGKPLHPHVEKVAPAIIGLLKGGLIPRSDEYGNQIPYREQMAKAYQMACNLDPTIRTATSGKQQVNRAKAAQNVGVVANTPGGQADVPELSVEEQLDREYEKLARRA